MQNAQNDADCLTEAMFIASGSYSGSSFDTHYSADGFCAGWDAGASNDYSRNKIVRAM